MSASRLATFCRVVWRLLRAPFWLGAGLAMGFLVPYVMFLDGQVRSQFGDLSWDVPSRVYARPLSLRPGEPLDAATLTRELEAARYARAAQALLPGSYVQDGGRFLIARRGFVDLQGREPARRIVVQVDAQRVLAVRDADSGAALDDARLDPARIATLYGAQREDRMLVRLEQLPPLLIGGLQAVEDRDFKHHRGVDFSAIARAAWTDLVARRVVQGGSTLTQQLVKNLFLDRSQSLLRKINEMLIAALIEARYDKHRILEAYVNEVFLGQQGSQAVHGFAAAAEFYFARNVRDLAPQDIALLVGMVRGPSLYDPRRNPQLATARRNRVLDQFYETGLIDAATRQHARSAPLGVSRQSGLPRNAAPAFMDLLRAQLEHDYPAAQLHRAGLAIYSTLAPSTQAAAESALGGTLDAIGTHRPGLQGAVVVTGARDGQVRALVGSRDPDDPGFDRALDARRPVGSVIKPFVYLVALAQPQAYSLASMLDDAPLDLVQPDGSHWMPRNDDGAVHGRVLLVDALAHSYNLATVRLGLALGVDKVAGLLRSFGLDAAIHANPSLLLGAIDLSPLQVAQLYQYFAADGHAIPLRALRGVLDAQGRPLTRYAVAEGAGEYVTAARLATHAMQQVAVYGTARAIGTQGLASRHAAGKTGTSDAQRDSWFAGFDGSQLAVVWVGRDDNKPTGLWGATGALPVWIALMRQLPGAELAVPDDGLQSAWIDPRSGARTQAQCEGARELPFAAGHLPQDEEHCTWQEIKALFGATR